MFQQATKPLPLPAQEDCPRCKSELYPNSDRYGYYLTCLYCGYYQDTDGPPKLETRRYAPRGKAGGIRGAKLTRRPVKYAPDEVLTWKWHTQKRVTRSASYDDIIVTVRYVIRRNKTHARGRSYLAQVVSIEGWRWSATGSDRISWMRDAFEEQHGYSLYGVTPVLEEMKP